MNKMKKSVNVVLYLVIIAIIIIWGYLLNQEFSSLPSNNAYSQYAVFNIKILLFSLFLICSITCIFYLSMLNDKKTPDTADKITAGASGQIAEELRELKAFIASSLKETNRVQKADQTEDLVSKKTDGLSKIIDSNNIHTIFDEVMHLSSKVTGAKRISIFMYQAGKNKLKLINKIGFDSKDADALLELYEGLSWSVFKNGKRMYATNIETHPEIGRKNKPQYDKKSLMILPIKLLKDETIGVMNLTEKQTENGIFTKNDLEIMTFIISILELKLKNFIFSDSIELLLKK